MSKSTNTRSTISGRFVKPSVAARSPSTTVTESVNGGSTHGVHRSAVSGEFVSKAFAKAHPKTTMKDS